MPTLTNTLHPDDLPPAERDRLRYAEQAASAPEPEADRDTAAFTRALRRRFYLTQREFAHVLGCHEQTVSKWERGYKPSPLRLFVLDLIDRCGLGPAYAVPDDAAEGITYRAIRHMGI